MVRAGIAVTRQLSAQLSADHGLSINAYEALLQLARAPDRRMRRVDLANSLLLTAGGVTRLLDGLERDGFVAREECASDRRVSYAVLTKAGRTKLREADEVPHQADPRSHGRRLRRQTSSHSSPPFWIGSRASTPPATAASHPTVSSPSKSRSSGQRLQQRIGVVAAAVHSAVDEEGGRAPYLT